MSLQRALVIGYPRTRFTLLINVIEEISRFLPSAPGDNSTALRRQSCDVEGARIATRVVAVADARGLAGDLLYSAHPSLSNFRKFASLSHSGGTLASACFSINALASEHIQKFVPLERDNDSPRQRLVFYKFSGLNFFSALLPRCKAHLLQFATVAQQYTAMRWEDLISHSTATIIRLRGR